MFQDRHPPAKPEIERLLSEMDAKIAALPEERREPLEQDLLRLRGCLQDSARPAAAPTGGSELSADEVLDNMLEECQVLDSQGRYTYLNAQARRMFAEQGIDPASLMGKSVFGEAFPDLPESTTIQTARRVMAEGSPVEVIDYFEPWKQWWTVRVVPRGDGGVMILTRNITERMQMIEALRISEKNLSDLIQYAPAGIYEIDFRTRQFITVNDAMCALSGYSREELLTMDAFSILDESGRQTFQKRIQQWLAGKKPEENVEYRVKAKDGTLIDVLLNVTFKTDEAGQPVGATVVGFNVTSRKNAERERLEAARLAEENRLILEAVLQQLPAGVVLTDADGQQVKTNAEMDRIWRFSQPGEENRQHIGFNASGQQYRLEEWLQNTALRKGKAVMRQEMTIRHGDGSEGMIEASAAPILDHEGRVIAGAAIVTDITERKRVELALRESEAALRQSQKLTSQLVNTSYEGIWSVDLSGSTTFINQRAAEILGYSVEEIQGRSAFEFLMAGHEDQGRATLAQIAQGQSGRVEASARHKDGRRVMLLVSYSPMLGDNGVLQGAMAMFNDITERKEAEEALMRKEAELREAQRIAHIGSWYWEANTDTGSDELLRIYGIDPEKDTLLPFREQRGRFYTAEAWDRLNEISRTCLTTGARFELDLPALRNGQEIWVTIRGEAVRGEDGEVTGLRGTVQDITERKRAELALHQSEAAQRISAANERARAAELEAIMDTVPAMIWISRDPACETMIGNQYGYQFLRMGPQENISKTAPEEALNRQQYGNYKDGSPIAGSEMPMQIAAATGQPARDYQFDVRFSSGETCHLLGNVNPLFDAEGKPSGAVGAFIDITALRRLQNERISALAEREVHHRLMEQREKERQSYARDIHDGPVQTLASLGFALHYVKEAYPDPALRVELDQIGLSVRAAAQELRQLINELRPPSLIRFGLARTIRMHAEEIQERYPQIRWSHRLSDDIDLLPEPVCLALYRIYQEAINNIVRHSKATRAWVRYQVKPQQVMLEIRDNGEGFEGQQDVESLTRNNHFGVAGIIERAEALGGTVQISSKKDQGTTILVKVPRVKG